MIEGQCKPVTALKFQGAEICLIREDFVRGWDTKPTPIGSARIRVLQPIQEFCDSYVDDLATFSDHWMAHLAHVRKFLTTMCDAGLTLKLEKCDFAKPQATFVGHIIGSGKHGVDPSKVACVEAMKPMKKEVCKLAGFFSYFRSYIKNYAELAYPITELTRKVCSIRLSGQPLISKPLRP